ncbi:MAG: diacylglycerol kinase family protein [bacterium]
MKPPGRGKRGKIKAIVNPHAGLFHLIHTVAEVEDFIRSRIPGVEIVRTDNERAARAALRDCLRECAATVIVVGGDGSLHEAIQYAAGTGVALGIVPFGTANNIANSLGVPAYYRHAVELIAGGEARAFDLGKVGRAFFAEAAGIGLHAEILALYDRHDAKSIVRGVYSFARTALSLEPFRVRLELDGEKVDRDVFQVTFSNLPLYGSGLSLAPDAAVNDGLLDVTIVGAAAKDLLLQYLLSAKMGTLPQLSGVEVYRVERAVVNTDRPVHIHLDAEVGAGERFIVRAIRSAVRIIAPQKKQA